MDFGTQSLGGQAAENSVAFSPDGSILASGGGLNVDRWDVQNGQPMTPFAENAIVRSVAFTRSGDLRSAAAAAMPASSPYGIGAGRRVEEARRSPPGAVSTRSCFRPMTARLPCVSGSLRRHHQAVGRSIWSRQSLTLVALNDGSSLAITPEGYYDASTQAAEDNVNVIKDGNVSGIGSYRDKFFRSDLLHLSLAGQSLSRLGFADLQSAPDDAPSAEFVNLSASADTAQITLHLRVITDRGGGIGALWLFLNGSSVKKTSPPCHRRVEAGRK